MPSSSVTIADIASKAGVSKMTVSKVLNNQPGISEATRLRIRQISQDLGYAPNHSARALAGGRTHTLGIIVPSIEQQYFSEIVRGADQAAHDAGLNLLISTTLEDRAQERRDVLRFSRNLVDGLLMVLPRPLADVSTLAQAQGPVVIVGASSGPVPYPLVDAEHAQGARAATEHLLALGHRRIAFLQGREETAASAARLAGYTQALQDAGLPLDPWYVTVGGFTQAGGFLATQVLLALPDPPTAIFAANDLSAFGALDAVRDRGLRVPEDVSVIGFDDIPQAGQVHPPLTTIRQPLTEMGRTGARMLLNAIAGTPSSTSLVLLPTELIIRATTAPPRPR